MSDYRMSFLKDVEASLANHYGPEQITMISNAVAKALNNYEITERCTDLVTLDDTNEKLIKRYRACLLVEGKSEKTIYQYIRTARKLSEAISKPFTEMGTYDIRFFLAMEQERGLSSRSRQTTQSYLSAFFKWMEEDDIIVKNPASRLQTIKCPIEVKKAFSDVEIDAIRGACNTLKERALIEMLLSTGVRVSELASMEVQDINLSDLSVHVKHGKGAKERITYTTTVSIKHLQKYLEERSEKGMALFYNKKHQPLEAGGIRHILKEIGKRAGVENVHPHRFRRTFATGLAKRGMEVQKIQSLLGHTSITTTMRYINVDDTRVQAAYRQYIA